MLINFSKRLIEILVYFFILYPCKSIFTNKHFHIMEHVKIPMFLLYSQFRIYLSFSVKIRSNEKDQEQCSVLQVIFIKMFTVFSTAVEPRSKQSIWLCLHATCSLFLSNFPSQSHMMTISGLGFFPSYIFYVTILMNLCLLCQKYMRLKVRIPESLQHNSAVMVQTFVLKVFFDTTLVIR